MVDTLSFDDPYEKQPSEQETIKLDLSAIAASLVVSGYALTSAVVNVFDQTGEDVTGDMVATNSIDGPNSFVYVTVKAGEDGQDYFMRIRHTWQKGGNPDQTKESDLLVQVREIGF
jgi:hypothetical protein